MLRSCMHIVYVNRPFIYSPGVALTTRLLASLVSLVLRRIRTGGPTDSIQRSSGILCCLPCTFYIYMRRRLLSDIVGTA